MSVHMAGVRKEEGGANYVITARVEARLADLLKDAARANCRTVSGEIRAMLKAQLVKPQRESR